MNKIVCMSTSTWHPLPTRKQQVMSRLKNSEILYFDPPITLIAPIKDKKTWKRLFAWRHEGELIKENIIVYATPPVFPFYNKFRFINKINQLIISSFVRKKMRKHKFNKPILWCYSPMSADAVSHIPHSSLIYDCVDRHSAYKGLISVDTVDKMERDLTAKANQVFTTSIGLFDTLSQYNENVSMLPNGANFEHFNKASKPQEVPDDMKNIKKPIIGFVGMLQECIDYGMIEAVAASKPEWSVVLIGGNMPGVNLDMLKKYENIHFLGLKPYDELPKYVAQFDVCMNTFRSGNLSRDVSPLKFFEYLASGKPVVSTPQPEQVLGYTDAVYIAYSGDDFVKKCEIAISEPDDTRTQLRITYGHACSWDARVEEMQDILIKGNIMESNNYQSDKI